MMNFPLPPVYRNMSKKEHDKYYHFCIHRDGAFCQRCRKSIKQLKNEWKKANPNRQRQLPYLLLHHLDGDERFPNSRDGRYAGNLRLLCSSCQQLLRVKNIVLLTTRDKTPEMERGDKAKPSFFEWVDNYLASFSEICKKLMINRGAKIAGVSQDTTKKYFDQEVSFKYIQFMKHDYGVECSYDECNDIHVCLVGELPRRVDMIGKIIQEEPQFSRIVEKKQYGDKVIES